MGCLVPSCSWAEYSGVLRGVQPAPRGKTSKTRAKNKAARLRFENARHEITLENFWTKG